MLDSNNRSRMTSLFMFTLLVVLVPLAPPLLLAVARSRSSMSHHRWPGLAAPATGLEARELASTSSAVAGRYSLGGGLLSTNFGFNSSDYVTASERLLWLASTRCR